MRFTIALAGLISLAAGQSSGNGMSKYTVASSDARTCLSFMTKYMKAYEDMADCTSGVCDCDVIQGRAALPQGYLPTNMGFGFHAIDCANHPTIEGEGLADIAAKVAT